MKTTQRCVCSINRSVSRTINDRMKRKCVKPVADSGEQRPTNGLVDEQAESKPSPVKRKAHSSARSARWQPFSRTGSEYNCRLWRGKQIVTSRIYRKIARPAPPTAMDGTVVVNRNGRRIRHCRYDTHNNTSRPLTTHYNQTSPTVFTGPAAKRLEPRCPDKVPRKSPGLADCSDYAGDHPPQRASERPDFRSLAHASGWDRRRSQPKKRQKCLASRLLLLLSTTTTDYLVHTLEETNSPPECHPPVNGTGAAISGNFG